MATSPLLARRVAARALVVIALLTAAPALGGPGDRVDRFPIQLTNAIGRYDGEPQLAMDETGRFVAVWSSEDQRNRGTSTVHFRCFAADATPLGDEISVVTESQIDDRFTSPRVAIAGDGSFVVIWFANENDPDAELYARRYAANDAALSDVVVVTDSVSRPVYSHGVATAGDGRFVVVWRGDDDPLTGAPSPGFARLFDPAAVPQGPPFRASAVRPGLKDLAAPQVAMNSSTADFVVTWETETDDAASTRVLLGRRFDAHGSPIGDTFTVTTESSTTGLPEVHRVAMSTTGQFVVVYPRFGTIPEDPLWGSTGVFGRRFDAAAKPLGGEFRVSAAGNALARIHVALDLNATGDLAVTWQEWELAGPFLGYLHTRLYRASGSPVTSDQRFALSELASSSSSSWSGNSVAIDGAGNFVAAFDAQGRRPNGVGTRFAYAQRFAGYNDTRPACARYIATIVGNDGANTLHGGPDHDVIHAGAGADTIHAWAGHDVICGGPDNDVIYAGSGNDHLVGGGGDDLLDGGTGSDYCNGETHTNADTAVSCEATPNVP